ncbi:vWA domain-containing protein [Meiothermus sp. CFH 77666]|uniref:vWA domain-containing protein n=1 Tax=Meiothermus sp. CFH 77666 TaxID=2817942 RepID=UPI001AA0749C|nr:vWA domain-containing protein [Meiothermus sp. CFH 77666]MBO1438304.1 VWA domain-containing protein [Meiothermus sp. CFH 77666]
MYSARWIAVWMLALGLAYAQDCTPKALASEQPPPAFFRYSFLVDTSASMVGRGNGRAVIFPQLQEKLLDFVRAVRGRAEVWITPFNQGATPTARFRLPEERQGLESYISGLEANGANTWLYRSLQDIFIELPADPTVGNVVYVLTDGIDNDRQRPSLNQVLQAYASKRGPHDFLYYVGLGQAVPEDIQAAFASFPLACAISAAVGVVPTFAHARVSPGQVDLGNFKLEPSARRVELEVRFLGPSVPLTLFYQDEARGRLEIEPTTLVLEQTPLSFRLSQTSSLPDGNYGGYLVLSGPPGTVVTPAAIPVRFTFNPGALYRLVLLEGSNGALNPGRKGIFKYRLEGNEWAIEPITVDLENLPQGLQVRFNGKAGPVRLRPGQSVAIELLNQGIGDGRGLEQVDWNIGTPRGARLALPRPPLLGPSTQGRWLGWLLAALLPLALGGGWLWQRQRPRRRQRIPTSTTEFPSPYASLLTPVDGPRQLELKEGQLVDLGLLWANPLLRGLLLMGSSTGAQVEELPEGVTLLTQESLEVGAILPFNRAARLYSEEGLIGSFEVINPRQATLIRWGKATFASSSSRPVSFDLGGLDVIDLGKKLNLPVLLGMGLMLSKGGLRLLQLPQGIRARTSEGLLEPGNRILFEQPVQLEDAVAKPLGEITFSALEGVPVPLVCVRYLGGRPEQRRRMLLLVETTDLGLATGETILERLRFAPLPEGAQLEHSPGNLRLATFTADVKPGDIVALGQSVFLYDLSSKASLGVIDVLEP